MRKLAVCGTIGYRNEIVLGYSSQYVLGGYIEFSEYWNKDYFDYKKVFRYNDSEISAFDVYVIAYRDSGDIEKAYNELIMQGIQEKKIIVYRDFVGTIKVDTLSRYEAENHLYTNLIFGMSHAKSNIALQEFLPDTFSFAAPSMDIFCHNKITSILEEKKCDQLKYVKNIFIELPYYVFNYDLSRFRSFVLSKMLYFHTYGDYHNYNDENKIAQYSNYYKVFCDEDRGQKYIADENTYGPRVKGGFKLMMQRIVDLYRIMKLHDKVWEKEFKNTIDENMMLFDALIKKFRNYNTDVNIIVIITSFNPLFIKTHKSVIEKQKNIFYSSIKNIEGIRIIDLFDGEKKLSLFLDHCHMSKGGSIEWTKNILLPRIMKEGICNE